MSFLLALWTVWFMFTWSYSPFSMALSLTLTALGLTLWTWTTVNKWMALTIALVYIGGMMIVFLYVCSLKNETKITQMKKSWILCPIGFSILVLLMQSPMISENSSSSVPISQLFQSLNSPALACLAIYLILVLFLLMETLESFKGALIKKF